MKYLLIALLLIGCCAAQVDTSNAAFDSSGTAVATFPTPGVSVTVTAGRPIVIAASWNGSGTATPNDSAGATIVSKVGPFTPAGTNQMQLWCVANASAGTHTFQVSLTGGTTTFPFLWVVVPSGGDATSPCDGGNTGSGSSTSLATAGWTATNSGELIVAFGASFGGGTMSAGTSPITFTADTHAPGCNCLAEWGVLGSTASSATFSDTASQTWGAIGISIKLPVLPPQKRAHAGWDSGVLGTVTPPPAHGQYIVWDDDASTDTSGSTLATLARLASRGEATILVVAGDSSNSYSAGALYAYLKYYKYSTVPVAEYQGAFTGDNTSAYTQTISDTFGKGPGDIRTNYPDCVTAYRTALADATYRSVVLVETGIATCVIGLIQSPADLISPLTGAQLAQQKVKLLSVMGGKYPSSTTAEFNFSQDPADMHTLVTTWTTQNGYPPIYFTGFDSGSGVLAGPPATPNDTINPVLKEFELLGGGNRGMWDSLAMLYAVRGLAFGGTTYFADNGDGTLSVDAASGNDTWSATPSSGHHYLTNVDSNADLSSIFNGFMAEIP